MKQNTNVKGQATSKNKPSFLRKLFCLLTVYCLSFLLILLKIDLQEETKPLNKQTYLNSKPINSQPSNKYKERPILTAYLEEINQKEWNIKPLPPRANPLKQIHYPNLNSCHNLPSQLPVDNYPEEDPFLPWTHDIFP